MPAPRDHPPFNLLNRPVDQGRKIRVIIIGAGVSGIGLYIRLLQHVPAARVTILEKNPSLGGTWYENRYPGVACDIPSHVYQYTFEPNTQWSKYFSDGEEIQNYVKGVARKYKVDRKIRYNTKVTGATWQSKKGIWIVTTESTARDNNSSIDHQLEAEVIISATGLLNRWKWPEIPGLHDFEGKLLHSANWDTSWDWTQKRVALIGCGSSAIQMLPKLQAKASTVHNFVRGGTWISQPFGSTFTTDTLAQSDEPGNYTYTADEKHRFAHDTPYYKKFRKAMERAINMDYPCLFPGSPEELAGTAAIMSNMESKLALKPEVYQALKPKFIPGCRRLTPGPGYLESLTKGNVDFITTPITQVSKNSIQTSDGKEWAVDAIACATGFDTSFVPTFPIIGSHGVNLAELWSHHASAYMSHSVPSLPNYFFVGGPNSATGGGSLLIIFESIIGYVVKAVAKLSREHLKSISAKRSALASWEAYLDAYFPGTVHVDECTSWYKVNGKITGLWPGSSLHARATLENPRWEDFDYETMEERDPLEWLGNGWTVADKERGDLSFYLDEVDYPPVASDEILAQQP